MAAATTHKIPVATTGATSNVPLFHVFFCITRAAAAAAVVAVAAAVATRRFTLHRALSSLNSLNVPGLRLPNIRILFTGRALRPPIEWPLLECAT